MAHTLEISTERFLLRSIDEKDKNYIFQGLSNPEVTKYYGVHFDSLESTEIQMKFYADLVKEGTGQWFAICSLNNNQFFGAVGLNNLNAIHQKAEIGFWLLPEFWGQGILQEAVPAICDFGFKELKLHRIEAFVETKNINSIRAMKRLNFIHEGTMIDCEFKNGEYISLDIYAKLQTL